jgi:hypothetical protein
MMLPGYNPTYQKRGRGVLLRSRGDESPALPEALVCLPIVPVSGGRARPGGIQVNTTMKSYVLPGLVVAAAAMFLLRTDVEAQQPSTSRSSATASKAIPRAPDAKPDMQGNWTNATYTPLERPAALKGKEFFTPEEAAAYLKSRLDGAAAQPFDTHYENAIWMTEKQQRGLISLRTSIIVEPRDGKIPPLNAEGRRRAAERTAPRDGVEPVESWLEMELNDRCMYWQHEGPPVLPTGYNSNLRIVQGPQTIVVIPEMMPVARIVPLDGRPRMDYTFRSLRGEPRGRWEGDTLVVESKNFDERRNWRGTSDALRVTERFTMLDPDRIKYEFTLEDPKTWDIPWRGEVALKRISEPIFEYACHEGNYGLPNILRAHRNAEAEATGGSR